jgi:predicted nucleotidyltransferase
MSSQSNHVDEIAKRLSLGWPDLRQARYRAHEATNRLADLLHGEISPDVSFVVNGSLARREFTSESDLDWTLLVDGQANPQHQVDLLRIREKLLSAGFLQPGREGTFGTLTFSHPIIHMIGGEDDSNANTTRRILLLLEASAIGEQQQAFENVRNNILHRYLTEDHGLTRDTDLEKPRMIPLFLLNDIARYWRTMTVDFAYKQHDRGSRGYALRTVKLGVSRKLTYASGLVACFWCDQTISGQPKTMPDNMQQIIANLNDMISLTPLERIAKFYLSHWAVDSMPAAAAEFFGAYDEFLRLLNNKDKRNILKGLKPEEMYQNETFQDARAIRMRFKNAIEMTFLKQPSPLYEHIISMGVF